MTDQDRLLLLWEMEKERQALLQRVEALIKSRQEISSELAHLQAGLYPVEDGVFCEVVIKDWSDAPPFFNMITGAPENTRQVDFRFIKMQEADGDNKEAEAD